MLDDGQRIEGGWAALGHGLSIRTTASAVAEAVAGWVCVVTPDLLAGDSQHGHTDAAVTRFVELDQEDRLILADVQFAVEHGNGL